MISMTFKKNPVMPPNVSHDQETWPGKVTPLATNCESGDAFPHRRLSTLQHLIDATGQRAGPVQSLQVKNGLHTLKIDLLNPKIGWFLDVFPFPELFLRFRRSAAKLRSFDTNSFLWRVLLGKGSTKFPCNFVSFPKSWKCCISNVPAGNFHGCKGPSFHPLTDLFGGKCPINFGFFNRCTTFWMVEARRFSGIKNSPTQLVQDFGDQQ